MVRLNEHFEQFAKHVGIPIALDRNGQIVSITTLKKKYVPDLDGVELETINPTSPYSNPGSRQNSRAQIPSLQDDPSRRLAQQAEALLAQDEGNNGVLRTANKGYLQQKKRMLNRYRFIIFLHCINDIPIRQVRTHPPKTFWVEMDVLDQTLKYKVEPQFLQVQPPDGPDKEPEFCRIDMNRCSVKYFFSQKRQGVRQYVQQAKFIEMRLKCNDETIYSFQIELQDFVSEQVPTRNYQKYFTVETETLMKLSWELCFTLGVHEGPEVDTSGMILKDFKGIVIPPVAYYSYEPLPATWEKILGKADVVDPLELTEEMDEFVKMPIYRNDEMSRDKRHAGLHELEDHPHSQGIHDGVDADEEQKDDEIDELYPSGLHEDDLLTKHNRSHGDAPLLMKSPNFKTSGFSLGRKQNHHTKLVSRPLLSSSAVHGRSSQMRNKLTASQAHKQSVQLPASHYDDKSQGNISDKPTDLGKDNTDERETNYKGSETAGDEDAMMMNELNSYNKMLNQHVSRIMNKPSRKGFA